MAGRSPSSSERSSAEGARERPARPRHITYRGLGASGLHELHACDWGRRDSRRVVVCAHGYSGNARDFDYLARKLSRDARVICPDIAGRGESAWLPSPLEYHFGQFLADIRTLLARLEIREVDWIGTSMGGLLGMMLAAQPGSPIRRLVLNDIGAFLPADALASISRNLQAPTGFATLADVETHLRHTHREWGSLTRAQWRQLAVHGSRRTESGFRLHFDPQIARIVRPPPFAPGLHFWDSWYRVRCPVLLVRGEDSEIFPSSVADTMLAIKPGTQLVEIPGCGHAPALMSAGQLAPVRDFLLPHASHFDHAATSSRPSLKSGFLGKFSALRSS